MHTVLLIDDSEETALTVRTLFKRFGISNPLLIAHSAEDGIKLLSGSGRRQGQDQEGRIKAVLINLLLPECQGFSVLHWIKGQRGLENLLRVVLIERSRLKEVVRAYELGAHTFLVKPLNPDDLKTVLASFPACWVFALPPSSD